MRNLALGSVGIDCRFHWNARSVRGCQRSSVAGLTARRCIKNGAIEHDATMLGHGHDTSVAVLEVGIVAKQALCRHRQLFSNGGLMFDLRSSHSGTGNFLAWRKSGLNNFD